MLTNLKEKLSSGWHFIRILRLFFSIVFAVQAAIMKDYLIGMLSLLFLYQVITNTGCYGESCVPKHNNLKTNTPSDKIISKEVK